MAGAVLGDRQVSLFVTGAILGEGHVSLFVTRAVLGEGQVSLFVAGAVLGEGSCSDHSRIGRALEMTFQLFAANFCQMLDGHFAWQAQYLVSLEGDICCFAHCE